MTGDGSVTLSPVSKSFRHPKIFAPCKVLNIRIMRTFNYNDMPHEVLEMASEYAIKESRSGRGLSHSQVMEKIKEQRGWRNH